MSRALRTLLPAAAALAAAALVVPAAASADAIYPIGPNQNFIALVNGKTADAVITVVCPFPPFPGETGSPTSGQYVEVEPETRSRAATPRAPPRSPSPTPTSPADARPSKTPDRHQHRTTAPPHATD